MKSEQIFSSFIALIGLFYFVSSFAAYAHQKDIADINMMVSADIPDFIKVGGLPSSVPLNIHEDGTLESELLEFYVERNGASAEKGKKFALTVKSTQGKLFDRYFLSHKENSEKLYVHVGLTKGTASTINDLTVVPVTGIESETYSDFDSKETTHTLALFNKDAKYLHSLGPGRYSADFTVIVQAK